MANISMTVNGREVSGDAEDRTLLVEFIRNDLGLTGTHVGCDTSQCGACVVHVDGEAGQILHHAGSPGSRFGSDDHRRVWPVAVNSTRCRKAFHENHGLQCGFCTPGMIMAATDMINRHGAIA